MKKPSITDRRQPLLLLEPDSQSTDTDNKSENTALFFAAQQGDLDAVQRLIAAKADVNARPGHQLAAIHFWLALFDSSPSAIEYYLPMITLLLSAGAKIELEFSVPLTPEHKIVYRKALSQTAPVQRYRLEQYAYLLTWFTPLSKDSIGIVTGYSIDAPSAQPQSLESRFLDLL